MTKLGAHRGYNIILGACGASIDRDVCGRSEIASKGCGVSRQCLRSIEADHPTMLR